MTTSGAPALGANTLERESRCGPGARRPGGPVQPPVRVSLPLQECEILDIIMKMCCEYLSSLKKGLSWKELDPAGPSTYLWRSQRDLLNCGVGGKQGAGVCPTHEEPPGGMRGQATVTPTGWPGGRGAGQSSAPGGGQCRRAGL